VAELVYGRHRYGRDVDDDDDDNNNNDDDDQQQQEHHVGRQGPLSSTTTTAVGPNAVDAAVQADNQDQQGGAAVRDDAVRLLR
jgi:hypothetical protein